MQWKETGTPEDLHVRIHLFIQLICKIFNVAHKSKDMEGPWHYMFFDCNYIFHVVYIVNLLIELSTPVDYMSLQISFIQVLF